MKTATFIKWLTDWRGHAALFKLSEPAQVDWYLEEDEEPTYTDYVVVSGVVAFLGEAETLIFPADKEGEVPSMTEMPGSFRGSIDHDKALEGLGYQAVYPKEG